jgi:hypothetical protein
VRAARRVPAGQVAEFFNTPRAPRGISINFGSYFSETTGAHASARHVGAESRNARGGSTRMRAIMDRMRGGAMGMTTALIYSAVEYSTTESVESRRQRRKYRWHTYAATCATKAGCHRAINE